MTEFQNSKQLVLSLFEIWILQLEICLEFGACNLLFPVCPGQGLRSNGVTHRRVHSWKTTG
jgi:hypothetical protein